MKKLASRSCNLIAATALLIVGQSVRATIVSLNFNTAATDSFAPNFTTNIAGAGSGSFGYSSSAGVIDQSGNTQAGGGVNSNASNADQTAVYTPQQFNVSDGTTATITEFVKLTPANSGSKPLVLGFLNGTNGTGSEFNQQSPTNFICVRILDNGTSSSLTSDVSYIANTEGTAHNGNVTGTFSGFTSGDWVKLSTSVSATGTSGTYNVSYTVNDYGPNGNSTTPTLVDSGSGPISDAFAGLSTASFSSAYAGFRDANDTASYDNFTVSADAVPEPMSLGLLAVGAVGLLLRRRRVTT